MIKKVNGFDADHPATEPTAPLVEIVPPEDEKTQKKRLKKKIKKQKRKMRTAITVRAQKEQNEGDSDVEGVGTSPDSKKAKVEAPEEPTFSDLMRVAETTEERTTLKRLKRRSLNKTTKQ
jgi:hypothetical protein